ncbi:MAG TPA: glycosyltransferase family 1 protein [Candidatus Angelobacter sp.]|nr:glycosyltransferase family 1 protein [Candidatus Angelobacter sp.]
MNNRPLQVAWDNSLARRNPTGTGVYASQLIQELGAQPALKLKVFDGWDPSQRARGVYGDQGILARAHRAVRGIFWNHLYFPYLLRKERFDLVHSPAFVVPFGCPCPSVVTILDLSFLMFPKQFEQRWQTYVKNIMPSVLKTVSGVICISEHSKEELLRSYKISPSLVHVVYCGIDHDRFHPGIDLDRDWARSVGLHKDYVLHVGTLSQRKNIPLLLRAVAALRSRNKFQNYQLVLAGPELPVLQGGAEIHETIRTLGLQDIVVLTGHVADERLPGLYAQAKLLVMPSLYEGFGLPVVESMAAGTPVVASNSSSFPEVAGDAALLVPPNNEQAFVNAMDEVLRNPCTAEELRRKGLERSRQFSWRRSATETIAVYRRIVPEP